MQNPPLAAEQPVRTRQKRIREQIKSRLQVEQTWTGTLAEFLTLKFGTVPFLIANVGVFVFWILINLGDIPGIGVFDPYPFNFLTMVVSLEAIVLSIIVLIKVARHVEVPMGDDPELERMKQRTDINRIRAEIERHRR